MGNLKTEFDKYVLKCFSSLSPVAMKKLLDNPSILKKVISGLNLSPIKNKYVEHLESVLLSPTKGDVTIFESKDIFNGFTDPDLENLSININTSDTGETEVGIYEMKSPGTHKSLFASIGDPSQLCLTESQIVKFCEVYSHALHPKGLTTAFLWKGVSSPSVVSVRIVEGKIRTLLSQFDSTVVISSVNGPRLVVKQKTS